MKLQRISDKTIFEGIGLASERTRPAIPVCLLPFVQGVDEFSAGVWVFTRDQGRLHAEPGDCIVFIPGEAPETVLKADAEQKAWRKVAETQPKT